MTIMKRDIKSMDAGLALVLLLLLAHHLFGRGVFVLIALVLLLLCMTIPGVFKPFALIWFSLSERMAKVMSSLFLTLVFTLLVIPMGFARRLMGKDTLKLSSWRSGNGSLFSERNHRFIPADLEQPY